MRRLVRPGEITKLSRADLTAVLRGDRQARTGLHHHTSRVAAYRARSRDRRSLSALRTVAVGMASLAIAFSLVGQAASATGARTVKLSALAGGPSGDDDSVHPVVAESAPSIVAFASDATNLTASDDPFKDVFVNDNGAITRLSATMTGFDKAGDAAAPSISADGKVVAFVALVRPAGSAAEPVNRVFVSDRTAGTTTALLPTAKLEEQQPAISPDGQFVAFTARPAAGQPLQVYLSDRSGTTVVVSASGATQGNGDSVEPAVSLNGLAVAFSSSATNLVPFTADTNAASDVFLSQDPLSGSGTMKRASQPASGEANGPSFEPSISDDGTKVAFQSFATNLVEADTNGAADVFVRDLNGNTTALASQADGTHGNGMSAEPSVSGDGRYVSFSSTSDNLVPGDSNAPSPVGHSPNNFAVFDAEGNLTYGTAAAAGTGSSSSSVNVTFPDAALASAVGATVNEGAVIDNQKQPLAGPYGRNNANPVGTVAKEPGGAAAPHAVTAGPDLVSATAATNSGQFCFDDNVTVVNATAFVLQGYNSDVRLVSTAAALAADTHCVDATFTAPDVSQLTVAAVLAGAVHDGSGRPNVADDRAIGTTPAAPLTGRTTGPDLLTATPNTTTHVIDFAFDETVDATSVVATGFGYSDSAGTETRAASATVTGSTVHAQFAGALNAPVRFFLVQGSAADPYGEKAPTESLATAATTHPDLVSVAQSPDSADTFLFTFSQPIQNAVSSSFKLYAEDATEFTSTSAFALAVDPKTVQAAFDFSVASFTGRPTVAAALGGAVKNSSALASTTGSQPIHTGPAAGAPLTALGQAPGITDGPDLQSADFTTTAGTVTFMFDEPVLDVQLSPPRGARPGVACPSPCPPIGQGIERDVFVHDGVAGGTLRASVAEDGSQRAGDSGEPSGTIDGRFVVFSSTAGLVAGDGGPPRDIFVRDLLEATVSPPVLTFADPTAHIARIGEAAASSGVATLRNTGFGQLAVSDTTITGPAKDDFTITSNGCKGNSLGPGSACQVTLSFTAGGTGTRTAFLNFVDNAASSPQQVELQGQSSAPPTTAPPQNPFPPTTAGSGSGGGSGGGSSRGGSSGSGSAGGGSATTTTTAAGGGVSAPLAVFSPKLTVEPPIADTGSVVVAHGSGFPPNADVKLIWSRGIGSTTVRTDAAGSLQASILVFDNDITGPRILYGETPNVLGTAVFLALPHGDSSLILLEKKAHDAPR